MGSLTFGCLVLMFAPEQPSRQTLPGPGCPYVFGDETSSKRSTRTLNPMDVALIRWPDERARRSELATRNMPRLLLLQPGAEPPVCFDPLEDWVRVPAAPEDVRARAESLTARFEARGPGDITLDRGGLLRFGEDQTRLTPLQTRLMGTLVEGKGMVVSRTDLIEAGWGSDNTRATPNALEANLVRLRRRLRPLGLRIRTIRSRGYLLEEADESRAN